MSKGYDLSDATGQMRASTSQLKVRCAGDAVLAETAESWTTPKLACTAWTEEYYACCDIAAAPLNTSSAVCQLARNSNRLLPSWLKWGGDDHKRTFAMAHGALSLERFRHHPLPQRRQWRFCHWLKGPD
jgi:hypothetical protein